MKKHGIMNAQLAGYIAALGPRTPFMVADAGMPIPKGVPIVDLVLVGRHPQLSPGDGCSTGGDLCGGLCAGGGD